MAQTKKQIVKEVLFNLKAIRSSVKSLICDMEKDGERFSMKDLKRMNEAVCELEGQTFLAIGD